MHLSSVLFLYFILNLFMGLDFSYCPKVMLWLYQHLLEPYFIMV